MHESGRQTHLTEKVIRLENGGMNVDFIHTSEGLLRIGAMPDVSKMAARFDLDDSLVAVPAWEVSQAGDNYTGEEFVFWRAQVYGHEGRKYIGSPDCVNQLKSKLDAVFPYFFDDERIHIVRKAWLDNWFLARPVETLYHNRDLKVEFTGDNITVSDNGEPVYNRLDLAPSLLPDDAVENRLAAVSPDPVARENLTITAIGSGNGFSGKSASILARFGKRAVWIDPCAFPAHSLADTNVHWDDITDILITHNHEDHMSGFSACLCRCERQKRRLRLITGKNIFRILKQQFSPLFPDMDQLVEFRELKPGTPLQIGGITVDARWNHHFLPFGTLGLRISAGGKTCGISGDTKFSTAINAVVGRPELDPAWFADCDLILHEVDFVSADGVHSYWEEVAKIRDTVSGTLYGYHSPEVESPPLPQVRDGQTFTL